MFRKPPVEYLQIVTSRRTANTRLIRHWGVLYPKNARRIVAIVVMVNIGMKGQRSCMRLAASQCNYSSRRLITQRNWALPHTSNNCLVFRFTFKGRVVNQLQRSTMGQHWKRLRRRRIYFASSFKRMTQSPYAQWRDS